MASTALTASLSCPTFSISSEQATLSCSRNVDVAGIVPLRSALSSHQLNGTQSVTSRHANASSSSSFFAGAQRLPETRARTQVVGDEQVGLVVIAGKNSKEIVGRKLRVAGTSF